MTTLRPLVLCGPSGAGKSTLLKKLLAEYGSKFGFSVSHTTRSARRGEEEHGTHYFFVTEEEMRNAIDNGEFIEYAVYSGNTYGTSKKAVDDVTSSGRICILEIDTQGVIQIKSNTDLRPYYLFIKPPSLEELETRLRARGTETEESLRGRLEAAKRELAYGTKDNFDSIIVNDDVDEAYKELRDFVSPMLNSFGD